MDYAFGIDYIIIDAFIIDSKHLSSKVEIHHEFNLQNIACYSPVDVRHPCQRFWHCA
jgi:hypothetical protein